MVYTDIDMIRKSAKTLTTWDDSFYLIGECKCLFRSGARGIRPRLLRPAVVVGVRQS